MTQIDTSALARLRDMIGGDEEDLAEFIEDFSEIAPDLVKQMVDGIASGDWNTVKIASHSLKSNSKDLGAIALSDLCAAVENESAQGEVDNTQEKVEQISLEMENAISAMQALDLAAV
uniref:HPt domain-containing protein n=1 Tax=uncultured Thiotrichaceae bacterium TaxID=298394 RepID=A0A6S6SRA0_9GAMM|nr:MAG: Unknown protein [uncultured Thiotrichaceae bacterium]